MGALALRWRRWPMVAGTAMLALLPAVMRASAPEHGAYTEICTVDGVRWVRVPASEPAAGTRVNRR